MENDEVIAPDMVEIGNYKQTFEKSVKEQDSK